MGVWAKVVFPTGIYMNNDVHRAPFSDIEIKKSSKERRMYVYMYMYMQILVAMGIQWGHGQSECTYVYWGWWCQISQNIKVLSKIN